MKLELLQLDVFVSIGIHSLSSFFLQIGINISMNYLQIGIRLRLYIVQMICVQLIWINVLSMFGLAD